GTLIAAHTTIAPDKPGGEDKIKLDTRLTIKPFNAASVLAVEGLPLPADSIKGSIAGEVMLSAHGNSAYQLARSLAGNINLASRDLTVNGSAIIAGYEVPPFLMQVLQPLLGDPVPACVIAGVRWDDGAGMIEYLQAASQGVRAGLLGTIEPGFDHLELDGIIQAELLGLFQIQVPIAISGRPNSPDFRFPDRPAQRDWNQLARGETRLKPFVGDRANPTLQPCMTMQISG
ncbi:MAG: hypothetical protein AAF418_01665, partial [Pseudomonadota bacterium]